MKYLFTNNQDSEEFIYELKNKEDVRHWIINHLDISKEWDASLIKEEDYIPLESVGCVIHKESGKVYPSTFNDEGMWIMEHDIEWFESLDDTDVKVVAEIMERKTGWVIDSWIGGKYPESKFKKGRI